MNFTNKYSPSGIRKRFTNEAISFAIFNYLFIHMADCMAERWNISRTKFQNIKGLSILSSSWYNYVIKWL